MNGVTRQIAVALATSGEILEAALTVVLICLAILDLLGELVGSIRELSGRMGGSTTKRRDESG
jgi:hypothetical protein